MADTVAEDQPTDRLQSGIVIGQCFAERYLLEALLGRGGMGAVYRVRDLELNEVVALKLLDLTSETPDGIERFRREVRLARRVTHRNAARTYDLGEQDGRRFLTMEYVDGQGLDALTRGRRLERATVLDITVQIAEGLAAAHAAQVVHRDLKPSNVLVEGTNADTGRAGGRVIITDFGVARGLHGSDATLNTNGTVGTPAYMAPEQLAGEPLSSATDVYALGLMLHELLTGELPFSRTGAEPGSAVNLMQAALARLHEPPPDLAATHNLDPGLAQLLSLMLAREPSERPSADRVAAAVAELLAELVAAQASDNADNTPALVRQLALAVLPFSHRGPADSAYIGEALGDELIDLLAQTNGLRVSGGGATARYANRRDRDPREIGRELGVDALVDGTVQVVGERVRISARLLDGATGFQRWSERFEGSIGDVFELQDKLGKRIAEALRLEVEHSVHRGDATPEAVEHYLRARQLARLWKFKEPDGAIEHLQRSLTLAPSFKPALAAYANACMHAWFLPRTDEEPDYQSMAEQAIEVALGWAPEVAETHLAAARWHTQAGDYRSGARSLSYALTIAPTYASALAYLGQLQVEGGRPLAGIDNLELAFELEPSLAFCLPPIARYHVLRGEVPSYDGWLGRYYAVEPRPTDFPVVLLQLRAANWLGDPARLAGPAAAMADLLAPGSPIYEFAATLWLDPLTADELVARVEQALPLVPNPRFRTTVLQVACEAAMRHGHPQLGLRWLALAGEGPLADADWLEHCAALEPLRSELLFRQIKATARARADAIWWR
ncbi:Serine/threonine protein kinase [Enhygromyxa salina]|uniref:Serine/threonine protein kinase n=1 Tax=Enhygromyxa salina TaxID=215803 RepID=A0A0C2DGU1_9BACT|nr:serine/threonine-protein kinase [Enhygromyxa salina]KIG18887.1 Serine/threonine protein kinase [Enhygromyxa salina]